MKFKKFSPETVAELLLFLAQHEGFASVKQLKNISQPDIRDMLTELSTQLRETSHKKPVLTRSELNPKELSKNACDVLSNLAPHEEETLFRSFKIA